MVLSPWFNRNVWPDFFCVAFSWRIMATVHGFKSMTDNGEPSGLIRGLGLWSAIAVVMGAMIGQAVFLVASDVARELGSTTKVLAVWIIGGLVVLLGSFCYAELGAAMPEAGGEYIYLSEGLGSVWGFLYGWTSSMIMRPGSAAIIAAGLSRFAGFLLPSVNNPLFTWHFWIPFQSQPYQFTFTVAQPLAAAVIVIVTVINYFGVRTAGRFQVFLTSFKVAAMAAIVILGLALGRTTGSTPVSIASSSHGALEAVLIALVPVMAAYNGFSSLGHVGGEILNPRKNLPWAAILGTSLVISLYVLINWIYFHVLGFSRVAQSQHVASDAVAALIGGAGSRWLTIALVVSAFGSLHANFLTGPRVPYAMARDGLFFGFAKRIQPSFHTPSGAVIFQGCVAILLVLTGTYQELYSFAMFAIWIFFGLTAFALIRLRVNKPELPRPYRVWGYPWTPVVFGAVALAISANLILVRPVRSTIGLAIMLLGIPFFRQWGTRASSSHLEESPAAREI
jgi:APA family basic amino acid/polyamine antiporter